MSAFQRLSGRSRSLIRPIIRCWLGLGVVRQALPIQETRKPQITVTKQAVGYPFAVEGVESGPPQQLELDSCTVAPLSDSDSFMMQFSLDGGPHLSTKSCGSIKTASSFPLSSIFVGSSSSWEKIILFGPEINYNLPPEPLPCLWQGACSAG